VARLLRVAGLRGRRPRRWKPTTIPDPAATTRADLVGRDFSVNAAAVNSRWCGDITYVPTWEGWLYLATVIEIASRRVVGFALAEHLRTELVADALTNAVAARDPAPGVVFHADRGCQYTGADDATLADDLAVILSSGRTGQCWDNALAESFFASPKRRVPRPAALAHPSGRPPRDRGVHRLVQRHPAAQRPWLRDPRRIRDRHPQGGPHAGSLTEPPALSVKAGQPHHGVEQVTHHLRASAHQGNCLLPVSSVPVPPGTVRRSRPLWPACNAGGRIVAPGRLVLSMNGSSQPCGSVTPDRHAPRWP
jgi:transposase InsO family protein